MGRTLNVERSDIKPAVWHGNHKAGIAEAEILEIGKDVADRRRTQVQAGVSCQRPGPDRLAFLDIPLYKNLQQVLGTFIR